MTNDDTVDLGSCGERDVEQHMALSSVIQTRPLPPRHATAHGRFSELDIARACRAASRGEAWAFDVLFDHYVQPVSAFVRGRDARATSEHSADALINEIFVRAFDHIDRFEGTEVQFRAWLFRIARHTSNEERADDASAETDIGADAVASLAALPADERDVILLRLVGDLSIGQAAVVMNRPRHTVGALQRRALRDIERGLVAETARVGIDPFPAVEPLRDDELDALFHDVLFDGLPSDDQADPADADRGSGLAELLLETRRSLLGASPTSVDPTLSSLLADGRGPNDMAGRWGRVLTIAAAVAAVVVASGIFGGPFSRSDETNTLSAAPVGRLAQSVDTGAAGSLTFAWGEDLDPSSLVLLDTDLAPNWSVVPSEVAEESDGVTLELRFEADADVSAVVVDAHLDEGELVTEVTQSSG